MSTTTIATAERRTGDAWYSAHPLPTVVSANVRAYTFSSPSLAAQVFAHSSPNLPGTYATDNSSLSWLGSTLAQTLCSQQLLNVSPTLPHQAMSDLRAALTSKALHAHLSRQLHLPQNMQASSPAVLADDRVFSNLFEAYLAGVSIDLGLERFKDLFEWYCTLLEPFVYAYHELYVRSSTAPAPVPRRLELAPYTSRLMEYAAKNKLEPPKFEFQSIGHQGAEIQWGCSVVFGGRPVGRGIAGTKLEAKHIASQEAMRALPEPNVVAVAMRRKKKEWFRARAKGLAVVMPAGYQHQAQRLQIGPMPPAM